VNPVVAVSNRVIYSRIGTIDSLLQHIIGVGNRCG
jgi:hypothetical protein